MKSKSLSWLIFLALALPSWAIAQVPPIKDVRGVTGAKRDASTPVNFSAAAEQLKANGKLADPLVANLEEIKKYSATITASDLEAHLRFIASDELEGRETGTRGQKVAARYLSTQFMKMGLQPGNNGQWYQSYELNRFSVTEASISLTGKDALKLGEDFVCTNKMSLAKNLSLNLAFAGFGIDTKNYDNLKGLDLKGKMAVILSGEPMQDGKSVVSGTEKPSEWVGTGDLKFKALANKGAEGVIVVVSDDDFKKMANNPWMKHSMGSPSLRLAYKDEKNPPFPAFYVSETTANALFKKAKTTAAAQRSALNNTAEITHVDFGKAQFDLKTDGKLETVIAENVLGYIEGTDKKDEVVVITAHFDHLGVQNGEIFNGADDDGTGTVALLEIAEAFMAAVKEGHRPRRSILFMPVSGEEKGLLGSEYYSDHPVYSLKNTVCDLNIDMIGRVDEKHKGEPQYIYVIGSDKLSSELHTSNEAANKIVSNLELDYTFNSPDDPNRFYYRSDHYNFAKHRVPVIFYFSGVHEDYHKSTDDIEKILFPRAARVAQLVFATAWDAAIRQEKLVVDKDNDFQER